VLALRNFNPIGADPQLRTGVPPSRKDTVVGAMIEASRSGGPFTITGTDYPTRDGTAVRDYVHVWDLAAAHTNALHRLPVLFAGGTSRLVVNLGSGTGTTVRELVDVFNNVTGRRLRVVEAPRRPGDLPGFYSRYERAQRLLGWRPPRSLADSVRDSLHWAARCAMPAES
jgi:UDP-glucose 4-epimerase